MTYEELKTTVQEWLGELRLWKRPEEVFRFEDKPDEMAGRLIFCTGQNRFAIRFTETYLGCVASSRIERAGETWTRGSDLPDGKFCHGTWDEIVRAIVGYELVVLAPIQEPVADVPSTV